MQKEINEKFQISPFLVFFLIHKVQIGVGILGFQASLIKVAGNDSWISVLIAAIAVHIVIWIIYQLCNRSKMDIVQIHKYVFGKWLGGIFSIIWILYFFSIGLIVLFSYFEVIQVWMFPKMNVLLFTSVFLILVFYTITAGFRIVTGLCFFGIVIPFYLYFTFLFPIEYSEFRSILPIWNHKVTEIGMGSYEMVLSYLGFSTLLMYYPYIKKGPTSQKWAHMGVALTTFIYLLLTLISLAYFSEQQVAKQVWATLTLWKIVEMPFLERFEYVGITSWALIILPNMCLSFWAASRGVKQLMNVNQRKALMIFLFLVITLSYFLQGRERIELFNKWVSTFGFVADFIYVPLLLVLYLIISKIKEKKA